MFLTEFTSPCSLYTQRRWYTSEQLTMIQTQYYSNTKQQRITDREAIFFNDSLNCEGSTT